MYVQKAFNYKLILITTLKDKKYGQKVQIKNPWSVLFNHSIPIIYAHEQR